MSQALTIDQILECDDVVIEKVETPAWGGHVYVRSISGDKRDEIDQQYARDNDGKVDLIGVRAKIVGMCLCDESGKFTNPSDAQLKALGRKSGAMLDKVFGVCQRINGMRAADVEELEKNSPAGAESGSGSS